MIFNIILKSNSEFSLNEFFLLFNDNKKYFQKMHNKTKFTQLKSPHVNKSSEERFENKFFKKQFRIEIVKSVKY